MTEFDNKGFFTEDLTDIANDVTEITIRGNVKNITRLKDLHSLKKVSLYATRQAQLDIIIPYLGAITNLKMYEIRCTDLSSLNSLTALETLDLTWNTKIETLWDMSALTSLSSLSIQDFSKLSDISTISKLTTLKHLTINSGMWNVMKLSSATPLAALINLESLELYVAIKDEHSILPIGTLKGLLRLSLPSNFPTEEYARLSVELPDTDCKCFQPYTAASIGDDFDILVVGKRKPFLNSRTDVARIEKYVTAFKALQDTYRSQS